MWGGGACRNKWEKRSKAQLKYKIIINTVNEILKDILHLQHRVLKIFQKLV